MKNIEQAGAIKGTKDPMAVGMALRNKLTNAGFRHLAHKYLFGNESLESDYDARVIERMGAAVLDRQQAAERQIFLKSKATNESRPELPLTVLHLRQLLRNIGTVTAVDDTDAVALEKKKKQAVALLKDTVERAGDYEKAIATQQVEKNMNGTDDRDIYLREIEVTDARRQAAHEAFIDAIKIANRFIVAHFVSLPEVQLEGLRVRAENEGREFIETNRVAFLDKSNVVCGDGVNLESRKSVARWGVQLVQDLRAYGLKFVEDILENKKKE